MSSCREQCYPECQTRLLPCYSGLVINHVRLLPPSSKSVCSLNESGLLHKWAAMSANAETCYQLPSVGPDAYVRWRANEVGAITERLERQLMLELLGDVSRKNILDVGCGDGEFGIELRKRGATVTGIDASSAMIDAATKRANEHNANITFRVAMADDLPFPAEQFDIVTAITILCFVGDAAPVFREIARVLRPGGLLVIGELGKWSTWAAERRIRAWLGSKLWRRGRFRTANELADLAKQSGLAVKSVRGAIHYPRWRLAARLANPCDLFLSRLTTVGAAFVAVSAVKPRAMSYSEGGPRF